MVEWIDIDLDKFLSDWPDEWFEHSYTCRFCKRAMRATPGHLYCPVQCVPIENPKLNWCYEWENKQASE